MIQGLIIYILELLLLYLGIFIAIIVCKITKYTFAYLCLFCVVV